MRNTANRPILVTGAHRSGTTWVGKMLSASPSVGYIEEPFSPVVRRYSPGTCNAQFEYWWMYVTDENAARFYDDIAAMLDFRYQLTPQLRSIVRNRCGIRTFLRGYSSFLLNRHVYHARPLLKDPIALFSTEWLARSFGMDVVIMIRHPAGFASSIKRMNWSHDFKQFLDQTLLLRDYLYPFEEDLRRHIERDHDVIDDAILLWRMFYHVVREFRRNHGEFIFLRHEDLSADPVHEFRALFARLDLRFTDAIEETIRAYSDPSNPRDAPDGVMHQLRRNSRQTISSWKERLSAAEVQRLRQGVQDIAGAFYSEEDWQ